MNYIKRIIGHFEARDFRGVNIENYKPEDVLFINGFAKYICTAVESLNDHTTIIEFTRV